MRRLEFAAGASVIVLSALIAGCEASKPTPTPTPTTKSALWDPCAKLDDEVVRRAGLDPATKEQGIAGVDQAGFAICNWEAEEYSVSVYSTQRTIDELKQHGGYQDFEPRTIAGRDGLQHRIVGASYDYTCEFSVTDGPALFTIEVNNRPSKKNLDHPCTVLGVVGAALVPQLPS